MAYIQFVIAFLGLKYTGDKQFANSTHNFSIFIIS